MTRAAFLLLTAGVSLFVSPPGLPLPPAPAAMLIAGSGTAAVESMRDAPAQRLAAWRNAEPSKYAVHARSACLLLLTYYGLVEALRSAS
jgi:hypothetical protein